MSKLMLMDAKHQNETRVVIVDNENIEDFDFVTSSKEQIKGNIYLAKITRVEPSLQAAFVEYGGNKQGFLPFSEIHPDYYQIPVEGRQRLIEEEMQEAQREEEDEEKEQESSSASRGQRRGRGGRRRGRGRNREENNNEETEGEAETTETENAVSADESSEKPSDDSIENAAEESGEANTTKALKAEKPVVSSAPIEEDASEETSAENEEQAAVDADDAEDAEDDTASEGVETVSAEETEVRPRRRGASFKRYSIQEVIKRNQIVLIQVIKEERGNKGCSLTSYLSLAGRYCVLMPNSPKAGGVSRKISNGEQRRKLKEMLAELREKRGFSAIVRTAGLDRTRAEIKRDYEYLVKMWSQIREDTLSSTAPSLIYEESDIIKRSLRDMYTNDIEQVLVQGEGAYKDCKSFMKMIMPSHAPRVKEYKADLPIFASQGVEEQLAGMYQPEVKMPSGGSIVIQATEALISIDVNSGRSTSERNVEETAIKTNLEAAKEVARQMRLRDVAGLVVIDFIDMYYGKNRRTLERAMKDCLKHDRAKIQVSRISPFGLMELSRQRLRPSIAESSTKLCDNCMGTGFVKSMETVSIQIIRLLEREAVSGDFGELKVQTTPDVALHLLNDKRHLLQEIESQNNVSITVVIGVDVSAGHFRLLKVGDDGKELLHQEQDDDRKKRKSRGRRGGRGRRRKEEIGGEQESAKESTTSDESVESTQDNEEEKPEQDKTASKPRTRRSSRRKPREDKPREDKPREDDSKTDQPQIVADSKPEAQSADKPKRRRRARTRQSSPASSGEKEGETSKASEEKPAAPQKVAKPTPQPEVAPTPSAESDEDKPKRKGWWNRVVQGEEGDS